MIDFIMRLFGYENIDRIHIYDDFENKPPNKVKMAERLLYYIEKGKFKVPIVIRKMRFVKHNWWLEDGYTSYLIAKENGIKYVKVVRI